MKILAVEFSSAQRSVAIWDDGTAAECDRPGRSNTGSLQGSAKEVVASAVMLSSIIEPPPANPQRAAFPAQRSLGLVEDALRKAACPMEAIEVIAVGLGPGSYTGIRGAIALAQGWQLGRGVKLVGLSTAECLAAQAHAAGRRGPVNVIIDAQRNEYYLARYEISANGCREVEALRLAAPAEIQALAAAGQTLFGPEIRAAFPGATEMFPDAAMLGRLACGRRDFVHGEKLEPIYLRETAFKKAPARRIVS